MRPLLQGRAALSRADACQISEIGGQGEGGLFGMGTQPGEPFPGRAGRVEKEAAGARAASRRYDTNREEGRRGEETLLFKEKEGEKEEKEEKEGVMLPEREQQQVQGGERQEQEETQVRWENRSKERAFSDIWRDRPRPASPSEEKGHALCPSQNEAQDIHILFNQSEFQRQWGHEEFRAGRGHAAGIKQDSIPPQVRPRGADRHGCGKDERSGGGVGGQLERGGNQPAADSSQIPSQHPAAQAQRGRFAGSYDVGVPVGLADDGTDQRVGRFGHAAPESHRESRSRSVVGFNREIGANRCGSPSDSHQGELSAAAKDLKLDQQSKGSASPYKGKGGVTFEGKGKKGRFEDKGRGKKGGEQDKGAREKREK